LKKTITIFALFIFFLSQFGKVVSFCFCSIASYQQTKTLNCDCEKQLTIAFDTESRKPISQNLQNAPQFDELFQQTIPTYSSPANWTQLKISLPLGTEPLYHTFLPAVFHPPLS
jgi:hypothetical protein